MGTGMIKIAHVLPDLASKVTLIENEEMVETFAPNTADEPFTNCIGFRRSDWGSKNLYLSGSMEEVETILFVIIADQKFGTFSEGRGFTELLRNPSIRGCPRYTKMDDPPRVQLNDKKDKDRAKEQIIVWGQVDKA
jgi:hypothetical protein